MAYLELSLEAYDDLIRAAGSRGGQVARVCNEQGVWETSPEEEAVSVSESEPAVCEETVAEVEPESEPSAEDITEVPDD